MKLKSASNGEREAFTKRVSEPSPTCLIHPPSATSRRSSITAITNMIIFHSHDNKNKNLYPDASIAPAGGINSCV